MEIGEEVEKFLEEYETATNSHNFSNVKKLLAEDAVYWFSDGSYTTIDQLEKAFVATWNNIKDENYSINDVKWVSVDQNSAVCIYKFMWKGNVAGVIKEGEGRGTNVMVKRDSRWYMIHEHLSKL